MPAVTEVAVPRAFYTAPLIGVVRIQRVVTEVCTGAGGTYYVATVERYAGGAAGPRTVVYGGHAFDPKPALKTGDRFVAAISPQPVPPGEPQCYVGSLPKAGGTVTGVLPEQDRRSAVRRANDIFSARVGSEQSQPLVVVGVGSVTQVLNECSGMGGTHVILKVEYLAGDASIRAVHYGGHGRWIQDMNVGDLYALAIVPTRRIDEDHDGNPDSAVGGWCLADLQASDGVVFELIAKAPSLAAAVETADEYVAAARRRETAAVGPARPRPHP